MRACACVSVCVCVCACVCVCVRVEEWEGGWTCVMCGRVHTYARKKCTKPTPVCVCVWLMCSRTYERGQKREDGQLDALVYVFALCLCMCVCVCVCMLAPSKHFVRRGISALLPLLRLGLDAITHMREWGETRTGH